MIQVHSEWISCRKKGIKKYSKISKSIGRYIYSLVHQDASDLDVYVGFRAAALNASIQTKELNADSVANTSDSFDTR